jgi:hypothetical protein
VGDLPVQLGALDAIPPGLRDRVRAVVAALPADGALAGATASRLDGLLANDAPWLGAEPSLAEVGAWMIDARRETDLRTRGCEWLALFPTVNTVKKLAVLATDDGTPELVREHAIRALGDRELRDRHASTWWTADAVQLADEALVRRAEMVSRERGAIGGALPGALRHVQWDGAAAVFARAPGAWADALECYATPALASVVLVSLDEVPTRHRVRAIQLVAAVLGEEAVPMLRARTSLVGDDERLELWFAVIAQVGEVAIGAFEDSVRGRADAERLRARAKWHLQHAGIMPIVRGLRIARASATLTPGERIARCAQAADDLGALVRFTRHAERGVYDAWAWMVHAALDPARAREVVAACPEARAIIRDLYLEDLARRGRITELVACAREDGAEDRAALWLAIYGRPLAALELASRARVHSAELACARVLAAYRAGRPDLADRVLVSDPPPAERVGDDPHAFVGPNERWFAERAPAARFAVTALVAGRDAVVSLARPAASDAEPDLASLESITALARRLDRVLVGANVGVIGELTPDERGAVAAALHAAGADLIDSATANLDFFIEGKGASASAIAYAERGGARRLRREELR